MKLVLATRKSPLALWQAEHVGARLREKDPAVTIELLRLTTKGDKILDQALSSVGGKDLFVKEIEEALLERRADLAVHSLKDMPTELPAGLVIAAYPPREDPRDALVSPSGYTLATLPRGARLGTCSLRRSAQLLRVRPDLEIVPIRGNVETRLRKVAEQNLAGTILAFAGLRRLGMEDVATEILDPSLSLPAIGQGVLAVETRADDEGTRSLVERLDDAAARTEATAERAFLHRLGGGCQVPIAAHATLSNDRIMVRGLVASLDGRCVYEDSIGGAARDAEKIGAELAEKLLAAGAGSVLEAILRR